MQGFFRGGLKGIKGDLGEFSYNLREIKEDAAKFSGTFKGD